MHIEKSLEVVDYEGKNKGGKIENFTELQAPYFTVEKISIQDDYKDKVKNDFHAYTVINRSGEIMNESQILKLEKEDTIYIPKGVDYRIEGNIELLKSYV